MKITSEPFVTEVKALLQGLKHERTFSKEGAARTILSLGERHYPSLRTEDPLTGGSFAGPHPMLGCVLSLAFDLTVDDWRGQEHMDKLWDELVQTFEDYSRGEWYPTEWYLAASYQRTQGSEAGNTLSIFVYCERGSVKVICPVDAIRTAIEGVAERQPVRQTDLRRLENLARFMPEVDGFQLKNLELNERLKT